MTKVIVVNGSPRLKKGNTAFVLEPFLQSMEDQGAEVQLLYASQLKIKPCSCGELYCWNRDPGVCIIKDSMTAIYPVIKAADVLVFATPVYIPLPGGLQNFINRLCPLLLPDIEFRNGRTRARFRDDVRIKTIVLLATNGWWEIENADTVKRIVKELAEVASVNFGGAIIRPHAHRLRREGENEETRQAIFEALRQAAVELLEKGEISSETLETISRPLVSREAYFMN